MTRLKANGWHVTANTENVIELVRSIDKGEFSQEQIRAEKGPRSNCWELTIVEMSNDGSRKNQLRKPETFPADDDDQLIRAINDYTRQNPGEQ